MNKKIVILIFVFSLIAGTVGGLQFYPYFSANRELNQDIAGVTQTVAQPVEVSPQSLIESDNSVNQEIIPARLIIAKLKVNTAVEHVGLDAKKNMDVPKNAMNVAWYQLGFKPGAKGNSVIAGHFDRKDGGPAVFYELNKLSIGDIITVVDKSGKKLDFRVSGKRTYDNVNFPIETVFGASEKSRLNLITCSGTWNLNAQSYSKRTVVFSELVSSP